MEALSDLGHALCNLLDQDHAAYSRISQTRTRIQSFRDSEYVDLIHMADLLHQIVSDQAITAKCAEQKSW